MQVRFLTTFLFLLSLTVTTLRPAGAEVLETRPDQVDSEVLGRIFSGGETMHYSISWSGGVKIGDLYLEIRPDENRPGGHVISAKVKDYGPLEVFYPVDDRFTCAVRGPMKLPYRYEVVQREGLLGKETRRLTWYDQSLRYVRYQKNEEPWERFDVEGMVYNEFASFIITRALVFREGEEIVVPTFADKKRHEVRVELLGRETMPTLFGERQTLKVQPKMNFKGLYDKDGDTILWITDDRCRVPVEIDSRIVIGSLVAKLEHYSNPACPELTIGPAPEAPARP